MVASDGQAGYSGFRRDALKFQLPPVSYYWSPVPLKLRRNVAMPSRGDSAYATHGTFVLWREPPHLPSLSQAIDARRKE